ncbi:glutathione S-transferase [Yoonia sp. MH D7]
MTYQLYLGNRLYFSWSIAAYLMFDRFGLGDQVTTTILRPDSEAALRPMLKDLAPARTLPIAITPDGALLNDSMAIAEELASRHPDIAFWPTDPLARGTARALANEMHSSFGGLRGAWPVNLRTAYATVTPPDDIASELDRLEEIWTHARHVTGSKTQWLCGDYSLVDAIFAPMATRLATYGFDTRPTSKAYVAAHLADPSLRRWRAIGLASEPTLPAFERDFTEVTWRGPPLLSAKPVATGTPENTTCPYSGGAITHLLEINDRIFGFCNASCRDKTVNDPAAWPKFMNLL